MKGFLLKAGLYLGNSACWPVSFSFHGGLGKLLVPLLLVDLLPLVLLLWREVKLLRSPDVVPSVTSGMTNPFNLLIVDRRLCSINEVIELFLELAVEVLACSVTRAELRLLPVTEMLLCRCLSATVAPISFRL